MPDLYIRNLDADTHTGLTQIASTMRISTPALARMILDHASVHVLRAPHNMRIDIAYPSHYDLLSLSWRTPRRRQA